MPEKFEGGEKPKNLSETEVTRAQNLVRKVREVVSWDLGASCSTSEEVEMVNKAKDAMKDVENLLHVPETKFWATFPDKDMDECMRQAEEYNNKTLPSEVLVLSSADLRKLRANLNAIDEVVEWDISASDETEITLLREARESLKALKGIL